MEIKNPLNQKKQTFEEMVHEKTIGKWTPKGRPELQAGDEIQAIKVSAVDELTPEEEELESEELVQEEPAEEPEPEPELIPEEPELEEKSEPEKCKTSIGYVPHRLVKAYKLFRVDPRRPGKLFPLFVDANTPIPMGVWVDAAAGEQTPEGKVKSKLGPLAYRPGFHAGDVPVATHIGLRGDVKAKAPTLRNPNFVWAEVSMPDDINWQTEAAKRMKNTKDGRPRPSTAEINDQVPFGGYYRYKTNPNMTGEWMISGNMRIDRVLTDEEVQRINGKAGVSDLPRQEPLNLERFGFGSNGKPLAKSTKVADVEPAPDNSIDYTGKYLAFVLTPESRKEILNNFIPKYKKIDCDHITVVYNITDANKHLIHDLKDATLEVIGYQFGPKVDCVAVAVNGSRRRIDGSTYHVTLSLKKGGNPAESNDILRQQGIQEVIPFPIQGELKLLDKNDR